MSEEQIKAFLEKVKGDTSLQEKLKAAGDVDAVAAIAKEAGFSISADDLKMAQSEISEEELEVVKSEHISKLCEYNPTTIWDVKRNACLSKDSQKTTALKTLEYFEQMSRACFIPCPVGWVHIDNQRVYEALDAGSMDLIVYVYPPPKIGVPVPSVTCTSKESIPL